MSVEDPFFVVQEEVNRAVKNCRELQHQLQSILEERLPSTADEYNRICNELKNTIRSVEWDLEDLEETIIRIAQSHPFKFRLTIEELNNRKCFINNTRSCIRKIKEAIYDPKSKAKAEEILRQNLLNQSNKQQQQWNDTRLFIENENSNNSYQSKQYQSFLVAGEDENFNLVSNPVKIPQDMPQFLGQELDNQAIVLNELSTEIEKSNNKMDFLMNGMTKLKHFNNDRRQWCAVGFLGSSLFVICMLLIA